MRWRVACFLILLFSYFLGYSQDKKLDSLISVYTKAVSDTDRIDKYADIGMYMASKGMYKEAITYFQKIVQTFSKTYPQKCIDAKNKIALNYIQTEAYDKADSLIKQIIEESTKLNYPKGTGWANRNLGLLNTFQGNYKKAVEYHVKALKIWEVTRNKKMISVSNSDLGIAFYYQGNKEKAAFYWENSLKTKPDTNSADYIGDVGNLGSVYVDLGRLEMASACLKRVLRYYSAIKNQDKYAGTLLALANIEYKRKNYVQTINYYEEGLKIREEIDGRKNDLASTYLNLAAIYQEMGKPKEALEYALKGYQKAIESENKAELLHAYNNLNSVYAKTGNYEKAYEFSQLYNSLKDSLNNIESQKQVNELDKQYQTEKKEKENQLLSKQVEIQQIQGKQQKMFLAVAGVVLVLICILAIVLFRQNKQKQVTNLKLELKNKIIEEKQKEIIDSIHYAKRIQKALITNEKYIERSLNNLTKNS